MHLFTHINCFKHVFAYDFCTGLYIFALHGFGVSLARHCIMSKMSRISLMMEAVLALTFSHFFSLKFQTIGTDHEPYVIFEFCSCSCIYSASACLMYLRCVSVFVPLLLSPHTHTQLPSWRWCSCSVKQLLVERNVPRLEQGLKKGPGSTSQGKKLRQFCNSFS